METAKLKQEGVTKADAVARMLRHYVAPDTYPVYVGDHLSDGAALNGVEY